jgi:hypothetical protein
VRVSERVHSFYVVPSRPDPGSGERRLSPGISVSRIKHTTNPVIIKRTSGTGHTHRRHPTMRRQGKALLHHARTPRMHMVNVATHKLSPDRSCPTSRSMIFRSGLPCSMSACDVLVRRGWLQRGISSAIARQLEFEVCSTA